VWSDGSAIAYWHARYTENYGELHRVAQATWFCTVSRITTTLPSQEEVCLVAGTSVGITDIRQDDRNICTIAEW